MLHPSHLHPIITCWEKYAGSWDLFSVNIKKLAFYKSVCCFILWLLHIYKTNQAQEHTRNQHSVCTWSPTAVVSAGSQNPEPKVCILILCFSQQTRASPTYISYKQKREILLFKEHSKKFPFRIFFYMKNTAFFFIFKR